MDHPHSDSPPILRPIPRRPFNLNTWDPTPPPPENTNNNSSSGDSPTPGTPSQPFSSHRLPSDNSSSSLNPGLSPSSTFDSSSAADPDPDSLSRAASFLNLQRSTLFGIFQSASAASDSVPASPTPDVLVSGNGSPWGAGAETPLVRRAGVSDAVFEIMTARRGGGVDADLRPDDGDADGGRRERRHQQLSAAPEPEPEPFVGDAANVAFRVVLLFGLGLGYGELVGRLRRSTAADPFYGGAGARAQQAAGGWRHLLFWGVGGVVIAALLPWFDGVWEARFGGRFDNATTGGARGGKKRRRLGEDERRPPMDWSLVLRAITAFLGIVFAIRKLAWTSTMQVSVYLAAVNPFLWYLIDRSKTGFLLSAAVSLTGCAVLMGLDPDLMPVPTARSPLRNNATRPYLGAADRLPALPSDETVETAVWMVSVLFCSCLCFGNIGRRMGLDKSAYTRGRWAGVR